MTSSTINKVAAEQTPFPKEYQWVDMEDGGLPYVRWKDGSDILADINQLRALADEMAKGLKYCLDYGTFACAIDNPLHASAFDKARLAATKYNTVMNGGKDE